MIHIIGLPHTRVNKDYLRCAYTQKVLKFCKMMKDEGQEYTLYSSEEALPEINNVVCITRREQESLGFSSPEDYLKNDYDNTKPVWKIFHQRVIYNITKTVSKGDIIVSFSGAADKPIADAFPLAYFVEGGIGYSGVFANFRVFESNAWMHTIYGAASKNAAIADGKFYDTVIPNYYNPSDFTLTKDKKDYVLFVGRMIHRKGLKIVEEAAKRLPNTEFILAGQGATQTGNKIEGIDVTIYGDNLKYIGTIDEQKRNVLMGEAIALLAPTMYIGPFEGVSVEANFCGTPCITTDFGCFTENNINGLTGYRCSIIKDFVSGISMARELDPIAIRKYAESRFSLDVVGKMYTKYFERIRGLENGGFYQL